MQGLLFTISVIALFVSIKAECDLCATYGLCKEDWEEFEKLGDYGDDRDSSNTGSSGRTSNVGVSTDGDSSSKSGLRYNSVGAGNSGAASIDSGSFGGSRQNSYDIGTTSAVNGIDNIIAAFGGDSNSGSTMNSDTTVNSGTRSSYGVNNYDVNSYGISTSNSRMNGYSSYVGRSTSGSIVNGGSSYGTDKYGVSNYGINTYDSTFNGDGSYDGQSTSDVSGSHTGSVDFSVGSYGNAGSYGNVGSYINSQNNRDTYSTEKVNSVGTVGFGEGSSVSSSASNGASTGQIGLPPSGDNVHGNIGDAGGYSASITTGEDTNNVSGIDNAMRLLGNNRGENSRVGSCHNGHCERQSTSYIGIGQNNDNKISKYTAY